MKQGDDFSANSFLKLPFEWDSEKLEHDLKICLDTQWKEHFNTADYSGSWTAIALRSQSGNINDILTMDSGKPFQDTALLEKCIYFREILGHFQCEKETVRLLRLAPGSVIKEHRDRGLAYRYDCFRIHIPIVTDATVEFLVGGKNIPMQKSECWYADFDLPHSVKNESTQERIHLVIDAKRNEWTDKLFAKAGYDFEMEKKQLKPKYNLAALESMIESLKNIGTETSLKMIEGLEQEKKNLAAEMENKKPLLITKDYIPVKLVVTGNKIKVKWIYAGTKRFTEPFFDETISALRSFSENYPQVETSLDEFLSLANTIDAVNPSAFIFHVSRCGSTLLAQMLAQNENTIVLSEAPLLDELLRLPFHKTNPVEPQLADQLFKAAIRLLGRRCKNETHLFIKCDSWHTMFYDRIRNCFPEVPFILLYRSPTEVLLSHKTLAGMQAVPGVIQPAIFGFDSSVVFMEREIYFAGVLEKYFSAFLEISEKDEFAFPISYHDGTQKMMEQLFCFSNFKPGDAEFSAMMERSKYHSKKSKELFSEDRHAEHIPESLEKANELFLNLEKKKKPIISAINGG